MKATHRTYSNCTVLRTCRVTSGVFRGGKFVKAGTEVVTAPCGVPIFGDDERASGICRSCRRGWEIEGNRFANAEEKARATGGEAAR
jgi:hypothetical protein